MVTCSATLHRAVSNTAVWFADFSESLITQLPTNSIFEELKQEVFRREYVALQKIAEASGWHFKAAGRKSPWAGPASYVHVAKL
jgi:hypothetical protein